MRQIRIFRIFLAIVFFVASAALLFIGPQVHPMAAVSEKSQIILSSLSYTIGATIVWLLISFLAGRIYCSTVCPVGAVSDFFARLGRKLPRRRKTFSYTSPHDAGLHILIVYILSLLLGISVLAFAIEPWNMMRNLAATVRPEAVTYTWNAIGKSAAVGAAAGVTGILVVILWALASGRDFCTSVCPLGAALGAVSKNALLHIEIDPDKCTRCGKCEDVCSAHCIKNSSNFVDNSRCLRCFDCLAVCDDDAIRLQINRNMPLTPLFRKRSGAKG